MGLKPLFSKNDIRKYLKASTELINEAIILRLSYIGEQFIINARNNATFIDQSGNLRGSIGFAVLKDGKRVLVSDFSAVKAGKDGPKTGKALIRQLTAEFNTGFALIVVAGMDYAAYVEAMNKDVLTASSIIAKNELKKAMVTIAEKVAGRR